MELVFYGFFEEFVGEWKVFVVLFLCILFVEFMFKYGLDKLDLWNLIVMFDVSEMFWGLGFKVFVGMFEKNDKV